MGWLYRDAPYYTPNLKFKKSQLALFKLVVRPRRIELLLQDPQSCVLSVERRARLIFNCKCLQTEQANDMFQGGTGMLFLGDELYHMSPNFQRIFVFQLDAHGRVMNLFKF